MFGQDNNTPRRKAAWAKVKASHGIEDISGRFLTQGELDTISHTICFQSEEIERLKGLIEKEYKKKLQQLQYDDNSINNIWQQFKMENNL